MSKYVERRILSSEVDGDGFLERVHEEVIVKLKRCPCCGNPAKLDHIELEDDEYIIVRCPNCGLRTRGCETHEDATDAWNARKVGLFRGRIKYCPFCGGKAEIEYCGDAPDIYVVQCVKCGAMTSGSTDTAKLLKRWNARV